MFCKEIIWHGYQGIQMGYGDYKATIIPALGANVISLTYEHSAGLVDVIRTPDQPESLINDPYAYGIPVLFPANRIAGGSYTWDNVTYQYPQNYPNGVHIHGILHNNPWEIVEREMGEDSVMVALEISTKTSEALATAIPIQISFRLENWLFQDGLKQRFIVNNGSEHEFPFGLAYHTTFNVPFIEGDSAEDIKLHVPIQKRCVDDAINRLPNGQSIALNEFESKIALPEGTMPLDDVVDYLYEAQENTNQAVFRDTKHQFEVVYECDSDYHYWIMWNKTTKENFIAVEPQTWLSNALCLENPKKWGVIVVEPHGSWQGDTQIFVRK